MFGLKNKKVINNNLKELQFYDKYRNFETSQLDDYMNAYNFYWNAVKEKNFFGVNAQKAIDLSINQFNLKNQIKQINDEYKSLTNFKGNYINFYCFDILVKIYHKRKDDENELFYCREAVRHNEHISNSKVSYEDRIKKIESKINK